MSFGKSTPGFHSAKLNPSDPPFSTLFLRQPISKMISNYGILNDNTMGNKPEHISKSVQKQFEGIVCGFY